MGLGRRKHFLELDLTQSEEVLLGGLEAGRVVRVGDTVRRAAGACPCQSVASRLKGRKLVRAERKSKP